MLAKLSNVNKCVRCASLLIELLALIYLYIYIYKERGVCELLDLPLWEKIDI